MADSNVLLPDGESVQVMVDGLAMRYCKAGGDFRIKCGSRAWAVDKIIISVHSKVFAAACTSGFKEGAEAMYDLSDHRADVVETLVFYMYNLNYDDRFLEEDSPLEFRVDMCIFADMYDIQALKALATKKFTDEAKGDPEDDGPLAAAATLAYKAPDPTEHIREHIVDTVVRNDCLDAESALEHAMRENADFATDVAKALQSARARSRVTHSGGFPSCWRCGGIRDIQMDDWAYCRNGCDR